VAQQVRVLIVDPHASVRHAFKALLQTEGLAVADLERPDDAKDVATALRLDVALIDVSPYQTEGLDLARRLSQLAERPAIVLMSAASADAILAASAGADLFLVKAGITADALTQPARKPRPHTQAAPPHSASEANDDGVREATRLPDVLVLLSNQQSSARGAWTQRRAQHGARRPEGVGRFYLQKWVDNSPHPSQPRRNGPGGYRRRLTLSRPASGRPGGHSPNPDAPGSARRRARPGRLRGSDPNWGHGARLGKGLAHAAASPTATAGGRPPPHHYPAQPDDGPDEPDGSRRRAQRTAEYGLALANPDGPEDDGSWSRPTVLTSAARRV
jgi:DNA-binding NarL/FixJ family response regulator